MVVVLLGQALLVGALFVYASFFEWSLHRFLMHRPLVVPYPFRAHTLTHHRNFRSDASYHLHPGQSRDSLTFAWWNAPLLIGLHIPVLWGVERYSGVPVVWTGVATLGLYYWLYEYGHWCMHVRKNRSGRDPCWVPGPGLWMIRQSVPRPSRMARRLRRPSPCISSTPNSGGRR